MCAPSKGMRLLRGANGRRIDLHGGPAESTYAAHLAQAGRTVHRLQPLQVGRPVPDRVPWPVFAASFWRCAQASPMTTAKERPAGAMAGPNPPTSQPAKDLHSPCEG